MGHVVHHAIIITTFDEKRATRLHALAKETGAAVSEIITSNINDERTFLVSPDGSKMGWEEWERGNERRAVIVGALAKEDNHCEWVEVAYGHDYERAEVTRSAWTNPDH